ncbi:MAG: DUF459 domain-containing protein [Gaiellaceae bacterium]
MAVETERVREVGPRGPLGSPAEEGRRQATAARALAVTALALVLAALLNAQNIYKSVYNKPEGTQREVALAFAGPLREVSMALRLDRPRAWVESAIGREHATIDTAIVLPPPPPPTATTPAAEPATGGVPTGERTPQPASEPEEPERVLFTPRDRMRLWIAGDSLVITPGYAIFRAFGQNEAVRKLGDVDGRVATGLTRPDVFNWFRHVSEQVRKQKPDTVVFNFGANDDHDLMTGLPKGASLDGFGGPKWIKEYRRRVGGVMDIVNRAGGFVVWLGLPITDDGAQSRRWRLLNRATLAEAQRRAGKVAYVDLYGLLSKNGEFASYLENKDGELVQVRAPDGVHLERAGGDVVAKQVAREVRQVYDVWSWKRAD